MVEYNTDCGEKSLETQLAEMTQRAEKAEAESADMACAAYLCGKYAGRKELEAQVTRLTKERDWLAEKLTDLNRAMAAVVDDRPLPFWKEAARKAVEGEGK